MGKTKKESKPAAAPKGKPVEAIKAGRVTKPVESAKNVAKEAAKKVEKASKKNKKKEPTPEPSSESEADDDTSASSASSEDDSDGGADVKSAPKTNGKTNGTAKAVAKDDDDSDSDDSDDDDDEVAAPKTNGAAKAAATEDSDDSDDSDSDDEPAPKVNGNGVAKVDASDDSDSDDSGSDAEVGAKANGADDDDSSDGSDSEEEVVKTEAPVSKKRKAEDNTDPTPKKIKATVNGEEKEASANLFVGNLSFNIDEEWLTREFEEYGQIKAVRVITDRDTGRSKGYGYVEFEEMSDAITAQESKHETEVDGRNVRVDFSLPRPERGAGQTPQQRSSERAERYGDAPREPSATLFVGNLAFGADESAVSGTFEEYGAIQGVRLITDRDTGNFKGYGYVEMGSIEEATAAFEGLQGAEIAGRAIRLDYASAKPTNDSPGGGRGGFGGRGGGRGFGGGDRGGRGRGGFGDRGGRGRGGRGGFDRGRGRGDSRGRGSFNRGGFGDFSGKKTTF